MKIIQDNFISLSYVPVITIPALNKITNGILGEVYKIPPLSYIYDGSNSTSVIPPTAFLTQPNYLDHILSLPTQKVQSVTVLTGGTGYTVSEHLTVSLGTGIGTAAVLNTATTIPADGSITTVTVQTPGAYSKTPTNPVSATTNRGATFNLSYSPETKLDVKYDTLSTGDFWTFGIKSLHIYTGTNTFHAPILCDFIQAKTPAIANSSTFKIPSTWFNLTTFKRFNITRGNLALNINALTTANINIKNVALSATGGIIKIDTEDILYTGRTGTIILTLTGVTRGANGTTPAAHSINAAVLVMTEQALPVPVITYRGTITLNDLIQTSVDNYAIFKEDFYPLTFASRVLTSTLYSAPINITKYNNITFFGYTESAATNISIAFSNKTDGTFYIDPALTVSSAQIDNEGLFYFRVTALNITENFVKCIISKALNCTGIKVNYSME
jgi:hypothetical protein